MSTAWEAPPVPGITAKTSLTGLSTLPRSKRFDQVKRLLYCVSITERLLAAQPFLGKSSKDFMKWSEESNNVKAVRCFVVFYGTEFNLKTLSVVALSGDERDNWIKGLNYLMATVKGSTYRTAQERMFRKSFYALEQPGREGTIVVQDLKRFMQKVSLKMNTATLKEKFGKYDLDNTGEIGFDDFCSLLQDILFSRY